MFSWSARIRKLGVNTLKDEELTVADILKIDELAEDVFTSGVSADEAVLYSFIDTQRTLAIGAHDLIC